MIRYLASISVSVLLLVGPVSASEDIAVSDNIRSVQKVRAMTWTHQAVFKDDLMIVGAVDVVGGFDIFRIGGSNPLRKIASFPCPGTGEGATTRWGDFIFQPVSSDTQAVMAQTPRQSGLCGEEPASGGIRVVDISEPANPRKAGFIPLACGSHNVAPFPDKGRLWLYNSNGCSGTEGEVGTTQSTGQGGLANTALKIEIIKFNPTRPSKSRVHRPVIKEPGDETSRMAGCHDVTFFPSRDLGVCVGVGRSALLDISEPANPIAIDTLQTLHTGAGGANFSWDGKYLFLNELPAVGGGYAESCLGARATAGAIEVWDVSDPYDARLVSRYVNPRQPPMWQPMDSDYRCFAGDVIMVPMRDPTRYIALATWTASGLSVLDFTDPAHPVEIGYWQPLWASFSWWAYWYDGYIFVGENSAREEIWENPIGEPYQRPDQSGHAGDVRVLEMEGLSRKEVRSVRSLIPQWQDAREFKD